MTAYRFELSAYEEIDIEAETEEEARRKAQAYWDKTFPAMFGGVEFMEEVDE